MIFPYKLIDLTHELMSTIPTWNGKCGFHHDLHLDYSSDPNENQFRVMKLKMHAGIGTHLDAPSHRIAGGRCISDFSLEELLLPCFKIDNSHQAHERSSLTEEDILDFENLFGVITPHSCVMVETGWSQFWKEPLKYHNNYLFPSVSEGAARLLLERGVDALGIDTLSPDRPEEGFPVHEHFLGRGKMILENVASLEKMPAVGSFVMVLPLKIKEATEAPARVIGLIPKNFSI